MPRFVIELALDCESLSEADNIASGLAEGMRRDDYYATSDGFRVSGSCDPAIVRIRQDDNAPREHWSE